jgi:DNA primase
MTVVEQIKERLPITEVLGSYITLTASGTQYKARCPFHNEKTASFYISPDRGTFYCFGCGAKGDIFTFVERFEGLDFKGALRLLAERAGISLVGTNEQADEKDELYAILDKAARLYQETLPHYPEAVDYLKQRGVIQKTINEFRIGYAPDEWRYLTSRLNPKEILAAEKAGLIQKTPKGYYDRFRGRIMFPLFDGGGRIIAFSGRMFPDRTDVSAPKYINSPETAIFRKSRVLYGFNRAKEGVRKHNFSILVEGQFDLVLSHQAGFTNTIATSGTAVSAEAAADQFSNLSVLARLSPNIILAFDGDTAGIKARTRAALVALSLGMQPKVVTLPATEDPASLLADGVAAVWKDILKRAEHVISAETKRIVESGQSAHTVALRLREQVFPLLARISSHIERQAHIGVIAHILNMQQTVVAQDFDAYVRSQQNSVENEQSFEEQVATRAPLTPYERLTLLLRHFPEDEMLSLENEIRSIAFEGETFVPPIISNDRQTELDFLAEREFAALDTASKKEIAQELLGYVRQQFYNELHTQASRDLRDAEAIGNQEHVVIALERLKKIHQIRGQQ